MVERNERQIDQRCAKSINPKREQISFSKQNKIILKKTATPKDDMTTIKKSIGTSEQQ